MANLVVALDFPRPEEALSIASALRPELAWVKVGLELFVAGGPEIVESLKNEGYQVFLDLKFYDIPNTVARAVKSAAELGANMLSLHCQGGQRMCEAAREAALAFALPPLLCGVTVLTSFAAGEMPGIGETPESFARSLAVRASRWGLDGVVCSGREAAAVKAAEPDLLCVCPGIRPAGSGAGDQRRTADPEKALAAGADFLVVGRPITEAADPVAATAAILREMANKPG